jgi:hypothetical protein
MREAIGGKKSDRGNKGNLYINEYQVVIEALGFLLPRQMRVINSKSVCYENKRGNFCRLEAKLPFLC